MTEMRSSDLNRTPSLASSKSGTGKTQGSMDNAVEPKPVIIRLQQGLNPEAEMSVRGRLAVKRLGVFRLRRSIP